MIPQIYRDNAHGGIDHVEIDDQSQGEVIQLQSSIPERSQESVSDPGETVARSPDGVRLEQLLEGLEQEARNLSQIVDDVRESSRQLSQSAVSEDQNRDTLELYILVNFKLLNMIKIAKK